MSAERQTGRSVLLGGLLAGYAAALLVAGVHGELLAGAAVGLGLAVRVAACRRARGVVV